MTILMNSTGAYPGSVVSTQSRKGLFCGYAFLSHRCFFNAKSPRRKDAKKELAPTDFALRASPSLAEAKQAESAALCAFATLRLRVELVVL